VRKGGKKGKKKEGRTKEGRNEGGVKINILFASRGKSERGKPSSRRGAAGGGDRRALKSHGGRGREKRKRKKERSWEREK